MEEGEREEEFFPSVWLSAGHEEISFRFGLLDLIEDPHECGFETFGRL
jgi:hypothetical protein